MKVYCDGIFDLYHSGHVRHFKLIKERYPNCHLTVGIVGDINASGYKRVPIYKQEDRYILVSSCKYVDDIVKDCPMTVTQQFMDQRAIDLVVHAFKDDEDFKKQELYYKNINFEQLPYYGETSTTDILQKRAST
jgi:cytidyltransferase-like protein